MKQCNYCGTPADDSTNFCGACGGKDFSPVGAPQQPAPGVSYQAYTPVPEPAVPAPVPAVDINDNGNIFMGFIGAFLFSIGGGLLYVLLFMADTIAAVSGLVMFFLAGVGYRLFARTKNKLSIGGLVSSIIATIIMIFLAQYVAEAWKLMVNEPNFYESIFEAIEDMPKLLEYEENMDIFVEHLAMGYGFATLACGFNIYAIIKERKQG